MRICPLFSFNYLLQRYSNNLYKTSNQIYTMAQEQIPNTDLHYLSNLDSIQQEKIFIFWNGNIQSTYYLITLLKKVILYNLFIWRNIQYLDN